MNNIRKEKIEDTEWIGGGRERERWRKYVREKKQKNEWIKQEIRTERNRKIKLHILIFILKGNSQMTKK
jgi:hypothetical protein